MEEKLDWEIGDWCYSDFSLHQIKDVRKYKDGNVITQVNDGWFNKSGSFLNNTCFPLDIRIKLISEKYEKYEKLLSDINDVNIIPRGEYSTIYSTIIDKWCKCCNDMDNIEKHYSELEEWYIKIVSGV